MATEFWSPAQVIFGPDTITQVDRGPLYDKLKPSNFLLTGLFSERVDMHLTQENDASRFGY